MKLSTKLFFVIISLLVISQTISLNAMDALRQRFGRLTWKTAAGGAVAGALTAAHYGCSVTPLWSIAGASDRIKNSIESQELDELSDANPKYQEAIYSILKGRCNFSEQELNTLKIKNYFGDYFSASTLAHNYILIPTAINDDLPLDNVFIGSVEHEAQHLKNHDEIKGIIALFSIPLLTHGISKALRRTMPPSMLSPLVKNCLKIPSGLGKGYANTLLYFSYHRHLEQRADDGIEDTLEILKAACKDHEDDLQKTIYYAQHFHNKSENKLRNVLFGLEEKLLIAYLNNKLPFFLNIYDHPTPLLRIQKFKQRIQALEQKSDHATFVNPFERKEKSETN